MVELQVSGPRESLHVRQHLPSCRVSRPRTMRSFCHRMGSGGSSVLAVRCFARRGASRGRRFRCPMTSWPVGQQSQRLGPIHRFLQPMRRFLTMAWLSRLELQQRIGLLVEPGALRATSQVGYSVVLLRSTSQVGQFVVLLRAAIGCLRLRGIHPMFRVGLDIGGFARRMKGEPGTGIDTLTGAITGGLNPVSLVLLTIMHTEVRSTSSGFRAVDSPVSTAWIVARRASGDWPRGFLGSISDPTCGPLSTF